MLKSASSLNEGWVGGKGEAEKNVDMLNFFSLSINHHSSIFYHPTHNSLMQLGPVTQHCPCYDTATWHTVGTQQQQHLTTMTQQHTTLQAHDDNNAQLLRCRNTWHHGYMTTMPDCYDAATHSTAGMCRHRCPTAMMQQNDSVHIGGEPQQQV